MSAANPWAIVSETPAPDAGSPWRVVSESPAPETPEQAAARLAALSGLPAPAAPGGPSIAVRPDRGFGAELAGAADWAEHTAPAQVVAGGAREAEAHAAGVARTLFPVDKSAGQMGHSWRDAINLGSEARFASPEDLRESLPVAEHQDAVLRHAEQWRPRGPWQTMGAIGENVGEALLPASEVKTGEEAVLGAPRVARYLEEGGLMGRAAIKATVGAATQGALGAAQAAAEGGNPATAGAAAAAYGALPPLARGTAEGIAARMGLDPATKVGEWTVRDLITAAQARGVPQTLPESFQQGKGFLRNLQVLAETGLLGGVPIARQKKAAAAALGAWLADTGAELGPSVNREALGSEIARQLRNSLETSKLAVGDEFAQIDGRVGGALVDTVPIRRAARDIEQEYGPYYKNHPQALAGVRNAWGWVHDLAHYGETPIPKAPDIWEREFGGAAPAPAPKRLTFAEAQKLRSDLLEMERNAPDVIKDLPGGWYKKLAGAVDEAMEGAARNADPEAAQMFRGANTDWLRLKSDFNDPRSMLYQALVSQDTAKVPQLFVPATGRGTPGLARQLQRHAPQSLPYLRRFLLDSAFGGAEGEPRFDLAHARLGRFAPDYLREMMGDRLDDIRKLALIGRAATYDVNPSGTARVGLTGADFTALGAAVAEALRGNGWAAAALASMTGGRLLLAKALLSPKLRDAILNASATEGRLGASAIGNIAASELAGEEGGELGRR